MEFLWSTRWNNDRIYIFLWVDIILRINYVTGKQGILQRLSCGVIPDSLQLFPETIVATSVKVGIRCTTRSSMPEKEATTLVTQRRANDIVSTFIRIFLPITKHFSTLTHDQALYKFIFSVGWQWQGKSLPASWRCQQMMNSALDVLCVDFSSHTISQLLIVLTH